MEELRDKLIALTVGVLVDVSYALDLAEHAAVSVNNALGLAGRAACVHAHGLVFGIELHFDRIGRKAGYEIVKNGFLFGVVEVYEYFVRMSFVSVVLGQSLAPFGIFGAVKDHVDVVEIDYIFHLLGRQTPVDPYGDYAELQSCKLYEKAFGAVSRNDRYPAAL